MNTFSCFNGFSFFRASLEYKVAGLELGADDYLPKPFHLMELNARIKSVIRRSLGQGQRGYRFGNVFLDPERFLVTINDHEVELLKKEFDILAFFIQRPNHLVDKAILAEAVWGDHMDQVDNFDFIYAQMRNLRQKLQRYNANIEVKAIYGFGYKLVIKE